MLGADVFLAPGCVLTGDIVLGDRASIWFGTVARADVDRIRIGEGTNVQDGCVLHVSHGFPLALGAWVTVGHAVVLHGCTVEDGALIGIGSRLLDGVVVGQESWIGAGSLVTPGTKIPEGVLAFGSPARVVRPLSEEERRRGRESAERYVAYAREYRAAGLE
ncbi:MAG: gamma carbonic anhydrase family protein [Candidatus Eisenbacteria bacterium]|nr:gamma carbonic anhydrase family protein [Candidatus Eisenbacteria bacterium]